MIDESRKRRSGIGWGVLASILVHVAFVAIFFLHLPVDVPEPQKEESVQVEIVPPPEPEKKQEEAKKEEPKKEEPKPEEKAEEAKKEEPPPPPPPPPPPKQEEAKKEAPPPPPPEQKPPETEPANEEAKGQKLQVLRPVFEFGEKDGGPRKSETGNASKEAATPPPETKPDTQPTEVPAETAEEPTASDKPPATPIPDDIKVPEVDIAGVGQPLRGPLSKTAPNETKLEMVAPPPAPAAPVTPSKVPTASKPVELTEAKTLFSQHETGDAIATTAMGNVPRGVRAGQLCATELREQLRHGSPVYRPELLPSYRLPSGTVLDVKRASFRADGQWYDLSFQCQVDENATKIMSFAFNVGAPVPRDQWRSRGFPEF